MNNPFRRTVTDSAAAHVGEKKKKERRSTEVDLTAGVRTKNRVLRQSSGAEKGKPKPMDPQSIIDTLEAWGSVGGDHDMAALYMASLKNTQAPESKSTSKPKRPSTKKRSSIIRATASKPSSSTCEVNLDPDADWGSVSIDTLLRS